MKKYKYKTKTFKKLDEKIINPLENVVKIQKEVITSPSFLFIAGVFVIVFFYFFG